MTREGHNSGYEVNDLVWTVPQENTKSEWSDTEQSWNTLDKQSQTTMKQTFKTEINTV